MRALVTGATGFVGSHLVEALSARGDAVAVLARLSSNRDALAHVRPAPEWIVGELVHPSSYRGAVEAFAPEVAYHLGWGGVGRAGRDDRSQIDANLAGTIALFDVAASAGCRSFVGLGSQAEYGPNDGVIDEATPLNPTTLYGAAKASACLLLARLAANQAVRFAWLRLFSAYGPRDHDSALIPYLVRSLLAGDSPTLSSGAQPWDYLYVTDAAEAIMRVGASSDASGSFNLASGRAETIRSVAERLRDMIAPAASLAFGDTTAPGLRADVSRLAGAIGWAPRTDLDDGLRRTVESRRNSPASAARGAETRRNGGPLTTGTEANVA